jgi:hypothetical protein
MVQTISDGNIMETFWGPDLLFDEVLAEISGNQLEVLMYIIRRTFGFKQDSDNISISQIQHGNASAPARSRLPGRCKLWVTQSRLIKRNEIHASKNNVWIHSDFLDLLPSNLLICSCHRATDS